MQTALKPEFFLRETSFMSKFSNDFSDYFSNIDVILCGSGPVRHRLFNDGAQTENLQTIV